MRRQPRNNSASRIGSTMLTSWKPSSSSSPNQPSTSKDSSAAPPISAHRMNEETTKKQLGVTHWVHDVDFLEALELLVSKPTVNIEGLVGGYTGPGGKTILPHRAVAKLDLRLVPDMTAADCLAKLKAHFANRGFGDIEVNMTGGYDPTTTPGDAALIRAQQ